jgi:long-chain acyl-CoA synthetase
MKDIIDERKRRKLDRPITGVIEEDRIWEQWYDEEAFTQELPKMNMKDYLIKSNENYEDQIIINNRGAKRFTVNDLDSYITKFSKALLMSGIRQGDRICAIGLSTPELVALSYGCFQIGAVICQLNFSDGKSGNGNFNRLYEQLKTINPSMIFILDILEDSVSEVINLPEFVNVKKVGMPLNFSVPGHYIEKSKIRVLQAKNALTKKSIIGKEPLGLFLNRGEQYKGELKSVYCEGLVSNIAFTSGTTGENKAVLLSHDANNALAFQQIIAKTGLERGKKHLVLVPPFLAFWTGTMIHLGLVQGLETILALALTYENVPKYLKQHLPQYGIWSQYLWDSMLHIPEKDIELISENLSKAIVGGERAEINQIETFFKRTGVIQHAGYGASEINTGFALTNPRCYAIGSSGMPLPYNNVKILDGVGNSLTYGQAGRLFITGPCLMNGYLFREDLTNQVLIRDNKGILWYDTKDYAFVDPNGNLFVLDRAMEPIEIRVNGKKENVQLLDIVEKIKINPYIKLCKLSNCGDYMVLHLVVDEFAEISKEEAINSIKETICEELEEKYWPHVINILDTLPRTQVGKVDYKKLQADTKEIYLNKNLLKEERLHIIINSKVITAN